jgi:hypothetical protein
MKHLVFLVAMGIVMLRISSVYADDEPITKKLDDAKSTFEQEQNKLCDDLTSALKKKADDARNAGDLNLFERAQAEADAWDTQGKLPTVVSTRPYDEGVKKSRMKMEDALKTAIKEYTKANNIDQAKATETELNEFKNGPPSTPVVLSPQGIQAAWLKRVSLKPPYPDLLTAFRNGGAGQPELVALGC